MAQKFVTNLNINQNELQNAKFQFSAGDPGSGEFQGRLVYDTTNEIIKYYNSSTWKQVLTVISSNTTALTVTAGTAGTPQLTVASADGSTAGLQSAAHYTLVNNATESDTASTIMKRDANGHVNVTKVTGLDAPTNASDAATKGYVDDRAAGLDPKESVVVATTASVTLASGVENGDTIDGITLTTGDRILLKDQSTGSENGVYTVNASGAPTRATDFDTGAEATAGAFFFVEQGTINANRGYVLKAKSGGGTYSIGTDSLDFSQFSGAGQIEAGAGLTKSGDTLNVGAGDGITVNAYILDDGRGKLILYTTKESTKYKIKEIGTVDYGNGSLDLVSFDPVQDDSSVTIKFTVEPQNVDIYSSRNNLITIDSLDPDAIKINMEILGRQSLVGTTTPTSHGGHTSTTSTSTSSSSSSSTGSQSSGY